MELSPNKMKEATKLKAPVNYIVMADLMSLGYTETDAYMLAYPENAGLGVKQNKSIRENILVTDKFKKILEDKLGVTQSTPTFPLTGEEQELIDKDKAARLILTSALKLPVDSKERIEGLMKYSDLMGYKKEDAETDNTENINFYFPLKCSQCPLHEIYSKFRKENGMKPVTAVEMGNIVRKAHEKMKKMENA